MVSIRTAAPALLLVLAGCVSGPDHEPPEMPLPANFSEGGPKADGDIAASQWWTAFGDSKLNAFAVQGLAQNLTIQQLLERINQAEAAVTTAGTDGLPSLTVSGDNTTSGQKGSLRAQTKTRNITGGGASVSWLLDLWGQYRRATESANASLDAAYSNVATQRLTFLRDLADSYVDARYYQALVAIARENLSSRRDTLSLTKSQFDAGAAAHLDVVQAEGLVNSTLSTIPGLGGCPRFGCGRGGLGRLDLIHSVNEQEFSPLERRAGLTLSAIGSRLRAAVASGALCSRSGTG